METSNTMRIFCELEWKILGIYSNIRANLLGSESRKNHRFLQFQTAYEEINVSCVPYITASVSSVKS